MRKLFIILIGLIAIITFIRALDNYDSLIMEIPAEVSNSIDSAAFASDQDPWSKKVNASMNPEKQALAMQENPVFEFEALLNLTCLKLQNKQAKYSVHRLRGLDTILTKLEAELDLLLNIKKKDS